MRVAQHLRGVVPCVFAFLTTESGALEVVSNRRLATATAGLGTVAPFTPFAPLAINWTILNIAPCFLSEASIASLATMRSMRQNLTSRYGTAHDTTSAGAIFPISPVLPCTIDWTWLIVTRLGDTRHSIARRSMIGRLHLWYSFSCVHHSSVLPATLGTLAPFLPRLPDAIYRTRGCVASCFADVRPIAI